MILLYVVLGATALIVSFAVIFPLRYVEGLSAPKRRMLGVMIAVFLLVGSAGLYYFLGAATWLDAIRQQQHANNQLRESIAQLTQQAAKHPDDAQHWAALAEAWTQAQDFMQAGTAWRQAVLTSGGHPDFIAHYAAALVMQHEGVVNEEALESIAMALKLDPEQPLARKLESLWHEQKAKEQGVEGRE